MHVHYDKQLDLLLEELIAQAENLKTTRSDAVAQDTTGAARVGEREQETGGAQRREQDKTENRDRKPRYLTLEQVLRFCFQYPPLMLPVVHFQRDLRFKIIGESTKWEGGCLGRLWLTIGSSVISMRGVLVWCQPLAPHIFWIFNA